MPTCERAGRDGDSLRLELAAGVGEGPAGEAVGDVGGVAGGAGEGVVEVGVVDGAAVVETGGGVVGTGVGGAEGSAGGGEGLLDAVAVGGTAGAVTDHLDDGLVGAGVDAGAGAAAVVRLHQAGVDNAVVGRGHADAALGLLHDDGQDEAVVDAGLARNLVDGALDAADLGLRVVRAPVVPAAGLADQGQVGLPELVVGAPGVGGGPVGAVTGVEGVGVRDGALRDGRGGR